MFTALVRPIAAAAIAVALIVPASQKVFADSRPDRGPAPVRSDDDVDLRERLRAWRRATAREAEVPAFVVFNDATLDDLVTRRPADESELLDVTGIGPVKVERYGAAILAIIADRPPDAAE